METTLVIAGIVCLMAAIVGGGLKAFDIEVPGLKSIWRQALLGSFGAVLLAGAAVQIHREPSSAKPSEKAEPSRPTADPSTESEVPPKVDTSELDASSASAGYIYLGSRANGRWVIDQYAPGPILSTDALPKPGDIARLAGSVWLRAGVPPADDHLAMRDQLGVLTPGTNVRIGTITRLDPEGHYWAQVEVLTSE